MRILLLTQYFPPEMGATQARLLEVGERLVDRGWEVEVLTALPNFPTGRIIGHYSPWKCCVEQVGRIRTARVPIYPAKSGVARRLASYFSFVVTASCLGPRLCQKPDIMLVESPPLFIGYAAWYLSWRWKCPYVFNVSDLWRESAARMDAMHRVTRSRMATRLELSLYRHAAAVTGQSDEVISVIRRQVPETPNEVIAPGVVPERFGRAVVNGHGQRLIEDSAAPVFLYVGSLDCTSEFEELLRAAESLPDDVPANFVLVGDSADRDALEARIAAKNLSRVRLLPPQPRDELPALLAAADVAIVNQGQSIPAVVPNKIYEAMASALPILLIGQGDTARRVRKLGCGLIVNPGDHGQLREAVMRLATDSALRQQLGEAGRRAAENDFNRERIADRVDGFLTRVVQNTP